MIAELAAFTLFAIAMSATPGPNNAMLAASGATFGLRRTLPHIAGVSLGFPLMLLALAFGLGTILQQYPHILAPLRWIGAAWLLVLAWQIATADPDPATPATGTARPLTFTRAALFQWINPKAWMIAASALTGLAAD